LIPLIQESWEKGVRQDSHDGFLWNGETCVHCSLAYHLRNRINDEKKKYPKFKNIRIWHEVSVEGLGEKNAIDLVIALVKEKEMIGRQAEYSYFSTLLEKTNPRFLFAIEVKYASQFSKENELVEGVANDFNKLKMMKMKGAVPVFVFLEGTGSDERGDVVDRCKEEHFMLLYGIETSKHEEKDWKAYEIKLD
jgi:hypothetical protein